ncbi:MAG: hypothetical protein ABGX07_16070, partial [Pirellulaceae bacterium]
MSERNISVMIFTIKQAVRILVISCLCATAARGAPPNIVVFLVDDMGVMDTSVPFLTDETGSPKRYP